MRALSRCSAAGRGVFAALSGDSTITNGSIQPCHRSEGTVEMSTHPATRTLMLPWLALLLGCSGRVAPPASPTSTLPPVPAVDPRELHELVQSSAEPVLVEFSVMTGCARCDQMRPQLQELAKEAEGRTHIVRMDFNANRELAASLGATVCPSYVLFSDRQPVWTQTFPTSGDLLSGRLSRTTTEAADPVIQRPSSVADF